MTKSAERFSLISQSILNRFTCNFAHTIRSHCGDCPENLVRFDRVFQKLLRWCTETTLFPHRQSAENAGRHWNSIETALFDDFWRLILTSKVVKRKMREMTRQSQWPQTHCLQCVFSDLLAFLSSFLPVFRWYLSQFSTDFHVILQALPATIAATALRSL